MISKSKDGPSTSISGPAAKLALAFAGDVADHFTGNVKVESERLLATDCRRLVIVTEPDAGGLFDKDADIGYVPVDELKDAVRDADRVLVRDGSLATLDDKGKSTRFVPFTAHEVEFPELAKELTPRDRAVAMRVDPALLGGALKAMAAAGADLVTLRFGNQDQPLLIEAEFNGGQQAVALVQPYVEGGTNLLPGMTMPVEEPPATYQSGELGRPALDAAARLADNVGKGGVKSITFSTEDESVTVDEAAARNIRKNAERGRATPPKAPRRALGRGLAKGSRKGRR